MVDYADIGKRIRACRLAKGMTQEQLANEVGVVVTHISHIETGNSVPSLKTLIDIINALDCSADELLCIEIKKAKPVFDSWMTEQLADCSADEAKIIKETVVNLKLEMHYPGDSFRPDAITAVTTIDGKQEVKVFLND